MKISNICNKIIEFSFYSIFLFVPLVLAGDTSELFEFNKMWLAFGLGIIIACSWIAKSILQGGIKIQRTPLDIPIGLFLLSQIMSTIFSWDHHISIWGYYSRFNGGLLSTILYIFLYYAFVSNVLMKEDNERNFLNFNAVKKILNISLISGLIVGLWGLPSHFGADPTCFLFRGHLDVACWANDFQPKIRIFSTLGQPDWLAAYMGILIPINIALLINNLKDNLGRKLNLGKLAISYPSKIKLAAIFYVLTLALYYANLLYSNSRSGIISVWIAVFMLFVGYYFLQGRKQIKLFTPIAIIVIFTTITFFIGTPFGFLDKVTYGGIKNIINPPKPAKTQAVAKPAPQHVGELGGTDSGKIRILVWNGAISAWKDNPLFGTGVETFAFAYYKYKSPAHNLTSEWNFLYNKAHNEFLNYLVTSGLFGLATYLAIIAWFFYLSLRKLLRNRDDPNGLLILSFLASYITIIITNFFGFSVVIVNIYLFLIPAFAFAIQNLINSGKVISIPKNIQQARTVSQPSSFQWIGIIVVITIGLYLINNLFVFWNADKSYAYGSNLDRVGYYKEAYPYLQKAVSQRPGEPIFRDELSVNNAILAVQMLSQPDVKNSTGAAAAEAQNLSQQALSMSNQIVAAYPNNYVFWKTRIRIFYTLSQIDPNMLIQALDAVKHAQALAPNDASINFNLGVIEGQNGDIDSAVRDLEGTIQMKPDYRDARYALGLFYHQKALDKDGKTLKDRSYLEKAKEQMEYILSHISSTDTQAKQALQSLEKK